MSVISETNENIFTQEWERLKELLQTETYIKLDVIRNHIYTLHTVTVILNSVDDLHEYIMQDQNIELITELYDAIDLRFSNGHPNFIFSFELKEDVNLTQLIQSIDLAIPTNEDILTKDNTFEYVRRLKESCTIDDNMVKCSVLYQKFKIIKLSRNRRNKGDLQVKTPIEIVFDFNNRYCYVKCGERTYATAIKFLLEKHLGHLFKSFKGFYFNELKNKTEFQGEYSLDKQTAILLNFIEKEVKDDNHLVTDYISVAFANIRGDKVKSVRLNGTNLLESYEVAERIQEGDKIKSVKFRFQINTPDNTACLATVQIGVEGILKITYSHVTNTIYLYEFNRHLLRTLHVALEQVYKESEVKGRMQKLLQKLKVRDSSYLQNVLGEIRARCDELVLSRETKDILIKLIDEYTL